MTRLELVLACLPAVIPDIERLTGLEPYEVLAAVQEARIFGHDVRAIPDESIKNVPKLAKPGPDYLHTVCVVLDS